MLKYYVYSHIRKDTNTIFYVGKGSKRRINDKRGRTQYWNNIVNKAGGFTTQIELETESEQEALDFEIATIKKLRDSGVVLCNITAGGECGATGYKHSPEMKEYVRTKALGNKSRTGQKATFEQRQKISQGLIGRVHSEATKAKMSKSMTGLKRSEEAKKNMSIARTGIQLSDNHKENIRKSNKDKMHKITVCGQSFDSIRNFAKFVNTSHVNVMRWIRQGKTDKIEQQLQALTGS